MKLNQMAKQEVLKEIMGMMDELMKNKLKGSSPKAMEISIESDSPDMDQEDESSEHPMSITDKKLAEMKGDDQEMESDEDEDLMRLKELYSKLK